MPSETHRLGCVVDADGALALLCDLVVDHADDDPDPSTPLGALGVDANSLGGRWDAMCEEPAKRANGPVSGLGVLNPSLTLAPAAAAMAAMLSGRCGDAR